MSDLNLWRNLHNVLDAAMHQNCSSYSQLVDLDVDHLGLRMILVFLIILKLPKHVLVLVVPVLVVSFFCIE